MQLISPATEQQFARYYALRWEILRAPWQQPRGSERDEWESQAHHVMVCDDGQKVAGVGRIHLTTDRQAQIRYMAVAQAYRNQGIGTQILNHLESWAAQQGVRTLFLHARSTASAFYQARGYRILGPGPTLYDQIHHVKMEKPLAAPCPTRDSTGNG